MAQLRSLSVITTSLLVFAVMPGGLSAQETRPPKEQEKPVKKGDQESPPVTQEQEDPLKDLTDWPEELLKSRYRLSATPDPSPLVPYARPNLLLEWPERFLGTGKLGEGLRLDLPTGATWLPKLWVFGTMRSAVQMADDGKDGNIFEWANRLDLFTQLSFTGTERILLGLRPLDEERSDTRTFLGADIRNDHFIEAWNAKVQTLFFEGDLGEIFAAADKDDSNSLDWGFSVGRQPLLLQDGMLINETSLDAVTLTRNTLNGGENLNLRISGLFAWDHLNRSDQLRDDDAWMVGLLSELDLKPTTINLDLLYVDDDEGDSFHLGVSASQRVKAFHNTFNVVAHALMSIPTEEETAVVGQGGLLFVQTSWTPHGGENIVYGNAFWGIDDYTVAARAPSVSGPLGRAGLLFSSPGIGTLGSPISSSARDVVGLSLGYQILFEGFRRQLVFEVGSRHDTNGVDEAAIGVASRYQHALGQHVVLIVDAFLAQTEGDDPAVGARVEVLVKF